MSYMALYRKWRPSTFDEVVEQEHVINTLKNSVLSQRISHAYLFCGTRGTGKTTVARIFSRAINCLAPVNGNPCNKCEICKDILSGSSVDVIEIDAASNNSVDNVREIRDEVIYAPSLSRYKVYIIDEVHMLSSGAFNALLKTLEEPPAHVVFFLATTEPHKLPATILSRCQRFDFKRINANSIIGRIEKIAAANGAILEKKAAKLIAVMADGALRDAISILDQCLGTGKSEITYNDVQNITGIVDNAFTSDMVDAIISRDVGKISQLVGTLVMEGKNVLSFLSELIVYYRNLLICKFAENPENILEVSDEILECIKGQAAKLSQDIIISSIKELSQLEPVLKWSNQPRILLEVALIGVSRHESAMHSNDISERIAILEERIKNIEKNEINAVPSVNGTLYRQPENEGKASEAEFNGNIENMHRELQELNDRTVERENLDNKAKEDSDRTNTKKPLPDERHKKGEIENKWNDVLDFLRKSKRMVVYSNLMDTKVVENSEELLSIVFGAGRSINKMIISKQENLDIIEKAIEDLLGRKVRLKCIDEDDLKNSAIEAPKSDMLEDEFVRKAIDIAKELNTTANFIDE